MQLPYDWSMPEAKGLIPFLAGRDTDEITGWRALLGHGERDGFPLVKKRSKLRRSRTEKESIEKAGKELN